MRLEHEVTVAAPVELTWSAVHDLARLAGYLPGARLEHSGGDNLYRGELRLDGDGTGTTYEGTARLTDVDEDSLAAAIELLGRQAGGPGTIAATIEARLDRASNGSTRIVATTDLRLTGHAATLGRDAIDGATERLLRAIADGIEQDDTLEAASAATEPAAAG